MKRLGMAVILSACASSGGPVELRFENASNQTFDSLEVAFGESAEFDALAPGAMTDYHPFEGAYDYGYVRVMVGTDEYIIQPIDYVGAEQLGSGRYTHTLDITGAPPSGLSGTTRKDD
jgi:hypothetical protein